MSEDKSLEFFSLDAEERMKKTIKVFESELVKVRTGRASPGLVEGLKVDYYGTQTPLNQISNIGVPDPKTILIQPWDDNVINEIEKAIIQSDLGITPSNDGKIIRLPIPALTEERRKELVKYVGKITEDHKVAIRQIRKDSNNHIKDIEKKENVPEDDIKKTLSEIQELTDKFINVINNLFEKKEKEILEI